MLVHLISFHCLVRTRLIWNHVCLQVTCSCHAYVEYVDALIDLWVGVHLTPFLVLPCSLPVILTLVLLHIGTLFAGPTSSGQFLGQFHV